MHHFGCKVPLGDLPRIICFACSRFRRIQFPTDHWWLRHGAMDLCEGTPLRRIYDDLTLEVTLFYPCVCVCLSVQACVCARFCLLIYLPIWSAFFWQGSSQCSKHLLRALYFWFAIGTHLLHGFTCACSAGTRNITRTYEAAPLNFVPEGDGRSATGFGGLEMCFATIPCDFR